MSASRRGRWLRWILLLAVFCGLLFAFRHPLMTLAARLWIVNDPLAKADAAVVLGGNWDSRPRFAGELYQRGLVQLVRLFNIIEQMGLRIAKAFENHMDDERGWHAELVHRLSIAVPSVRPAVYLPPILPPLKDLRGFRHVVSHAYDLELDVERLAIVVRHAAEVTSLLPVMVAEFFNTVEQDPR